MWVERRKSQPTNDKLSLKWVGCGHFTWSSLNFKAPNHISGITEARIVKFLTQVGCIKCYQKDDISPLHLRGCGHVTVFKCCCLSATADTCRCRCRNCLRCNSWRRAYLGGVCIPWELSCWTDTDCVCCLHQNFSRLLLVTSLNW